MSIFFLIFALIFLIPSIMFLSQSYKSAQGPDIKGKLVAMFTMNDFMTILYIIGALLAFLLGLKIFIVSFEDD